MTRRHTAEDVRACFGCAHVTQDGEDIWIEGPMTGHWLTDAEWSQLERHLAHQDDDPRPEPAPIPEPQPTATQPVVPNKVRRKSSIRVEQVSPQQHHEAGFIAFAILAATSIHEPQDALQFALNLIKLRDKVRSRCRKAEEWLKTRSPSLARRLRTLDTHVQGIVDRLVELEGTGSLAISNKEGGAVSLVYGNSSLRLG